MKLVDIEKKTIRASADYSLSFRFRMWVALVEDMDLLNMGHRAYHSHILESFSTWRASGYHFKNYRNKELNIDALKADDVYGFRGKRGQAPLGPKRNIEPAKISVLYAFFQKKYPDLAASFDDNAPLTELTAILRSFYTKEVRSDLSQEDLSGICQQGDGIYVPRISIGASEIRRAMKEGRPFLQTVPVYLVASSPKRDFCIVHRVEFPFHAKYLKEDSVDYHDFDRLRAWIDRHSPESTALYSGVGIPVPPQLTGANSSLMCVLRDRVLYEPFTCSLEILRIEEGDNFEDPYKITIGARERSGQDVLKTFVYCQGDKHYDIIKNDISFSAEFMTDLINLKTSLGMEI